MKTIVLNPFTLDPDAHSLAHGLSCPEPTLTTQADAASADINNIVKQFGVTGSLPYGGATPFYDDVSEFPTDYHSALNFVMEAQETFLEYPADIRARFDNDPGLFLNSFNDPSKRELLEELGFVLSKSNESPSGSEDSIKQPKGASEPAAAGDAQSHT